MSTTNQTIKLIDNFMADHHIPVYGIASIDQFSGAPEGHHPCDILPDAKSVVVFAYAHTKASYISKQAECYSLIRNILTNQLNQISVELAYYLESNNMLSLPINCVGSSTQNTSGRHLGIISLKHAAVLAGLGFFGKNSLVINEDYGNRLWFGAVLTTAHIQKSLPSNLQSDSVDVMCPEHCTKCVDACPANALMKDNFNMNQERCHEYAFDYSKETFHISCFECRRICPLKFGQKAIRS